jgi:CBS domain-containing protein
MIVADIMTREVITVRPDLDIHSLARLLTQAHVSGAPVVDDQGHLVGVVSLSDLVAHEGQVGDTETAAYWHGDPRLPGGYSMVDLSQSETQVHHIMTPATFHIDRGVGLLELCDFFLLGQIHRVLVTDQGRLVGIVTPTDLLRAIRPMLEQSAAHR